MDEKLSTQQVAIDFPAWMAEELEQRAQELGVDQQDIIKVWIADRIEAKHRRAA